MLHGTERWNKYQLKLNKILKDKSAKDKSKINKEIFDFGKELMREYSLKCIYNKYGEQYYQKTPDVANAFTMIRTGYSNIVKSDQNKFIPVQSEKDKEKDYIPYGEIENINQRNLDKLFFNFSDTFSGHNKYLYFDKEKMERPKQLFDEAVNGLIDYVDNNIVKNI